VRLCSYLHQGRPSYGVVDEGSGGAAVRDLGSLLGARAAGLRQLLADPNGLNDAAIAAVRAPVLPLDDVTLLPPVTDPTRVLCVGLNYHDHRAETGRGIGDEHPTIFVRFASSFVAHGEPVLVPRASERLDYEGELAVIIGRRGRHIGPADALSYVAGYSCLDDGSVRDYQRHTSQFTPGKNFDASGSFGPWLVTADEVPDPSALELTTRVNGEVRQHATTDQLIFDIPTVIAYCSTFTTLEPGDVIATGTPGGVGSAMDPPRWLRPGDVLEVEISGVGTLRTPVAAEA